MLMLMLYTQKTRRGATPIGGKAVAPPCSSLQPLLTLVSARASCFHQAPAMKLPLALFSLFLLTALLPPPLRAAKPPFSATEKLTPFIEHLDAMLSSGPLKGPNAAFVSNAPAKLAILKTTFIEHMATEPALQAKYAAAIRTCDMISAAVDERQRTFGQMQAANAVKGSDTIGQRRKDVLNQGVRGGTYAKAVGEVQEGKREQREHKEQAARAKADDNAISAGVLNHWKERAIQLRQQILASYTQVALASAAAAAPAPAPAPARVPVPAPAPTSVPAPGLAPVPAR